MLKTASRRIADFTAWLGPGRTRFIFVLLSVTGLMSLVLNAVTPAPEWVAVAQSVLAVIFLIGAVGAVVTRFPPAERRQAMWMAVPSALAVALGLLFPSLGVVMFVVAAGWVVIATVTTRSAVRREYQAAIRHLRKNEYDAAIAIMNDLIRAEPKHADHYRFRAELLRLAGKARKARADYEKVVALTPESGVGYNGLAEVLLQNGEYQAALPYAEKALALEPREWVPAYNLGMIEDRLGRWADAVTHLRQALNAPVPDSRHRLLAHLWLARSAVNLDDRSAANAALDSLKKESAGLREWARIFASEQAVVLRDVLGEDVALAEKLAAGKIEVESLKVAGGTGS